MRSFHAAVLWSLTATAGMLLVAPTSVAAEKVVLKYSIFRESIPVSDLETLAETGRTDPAIESYIRRAGKKPEDLQRVLTSTVKVDQVTLDRRLNSLPGNLILDEVGKAIHTPAGGADRQALRAALVKSAEEDDRISLLEVIQNYPTAEVVVEGEQLVSTYRQLSKIADPLQKILGILKQI
jgi:hypothetical protein